MFKTGSALATINVNIEIKIITLVILSGHRYAKVVLRFFFLLFIYRQTAGVPPLVRYYNLR